jgi:hypothetical protein
MPMAVEPSCGSFPIQVLLAPEAPMHAAHTPPQSCWRFNPMGENFASKAKETAEAAIST